ncbi:uncharacterized protein LOC125047881 [Penaeus chinensis]|uniref:uncharacterized protein LOC125047881 n=1 Tax=Penaeus chinensis TaxID=139456 RepID=UPI001FB61EF8|nr:uncharacterized protein LOC125047881 [Penaeus chinensis]
MGTSADYLGDRAKRTKSTKRTKRTKAFVLRGLWRFGRCSRASVQADGVVFCVAVLLICSLCFVECQGDTGPDDVTMATFQRSGAASKDTYLKYLSEIPDLVQLTLCFRLYLFQARDEIMVLSYAHPENDNELYFGFHYKNSELMMTCCDPKWTRDVKLNVELRVWSSICVSLDLANGKNVVVQDGRVMPAIIDESLGTPFIRGGGMLYIGQEQDRPGEGFDKTQSLAGSLVDYRLYEKIFSTRILKQYTNCEPMQVSATPFIDFSNITSDFEVSDVEIEDGVGSHFCSERKPYDVLFPEVRTFDEASHHCQILAANLKAPKTNDDNTELNNLTLKHVDTCGSVWLGVRRNVTGRYWYDTATQTKITYANFGYKAAFDDSETCASFKRSQDTVSSGEWAPRNCEMKFCAVCRFKQMSFLKLRGLCERSLFDREYFLPNTKDSPMFNGAYYSVITKHTPPENASASDFGFWQLSRLDDPSVRATLALRFPTHYPVGLNNWTVSNDVCGGREVPLRMTSCKEHQFSCDDGTCIPIHQRCNKEINCLDESDEVSCNFLVFPSRYDDKSPPPRLHPSSPVNVSVYVLMLSMRAFDLTGFNFVCEIEVRFSWKDSRLTLLHLKKDSFLNIIHLTERMPWKPDVEFFGDALTTSDVNTRYSFLMGQRKKKPLPDNSAKLWEDETFEGRDNPLVMVQKLTVTTSCQFDLITFPFDTQTCKLGLVLRGLTKDYIALVPEGPGIKYIGKRKLLEYYLKEEFMAPEDVGNYSGQVIEMKFRNLSTFYVTSTYIPTFIIVVIGYIVFFFPVEDFNERIMVALTALLVEAAFFTQMSSSIPQTAYLKLVDIWFVYCITSLFLVVVTVAFINWCKKCAPAFVLWLRKHELKSEGRLASRRTALASRLNILCRIVCPILTALFFIFYLTMAALIEIPELPIEIPNYQSFFSE